MDKCNLNLKKYIGTKVVEARPMSEIDAESIGYARKNSDNHEWRNGYHVRYTNPDGSFYDSWSPKDVFDEAYKPCETFLDRLLLEQQELKNRVNKLRLFLSTEGSKTEVGSFQFVRMTEQLEAMKAYLNILTRRIEDLKDESTTCS